MSWLLRHVAGHCSRPPCCFPVTRTLAGTQIHKHRTLEFIRRKTKCSDRQTLESLHPLFITLCVRVCVRVSVCLCGCPSETGQREKSLRWSVTGSGSTVAFPPFRQTDRNIVHSPCSCSELSCCLSCGCSPKSCSPISEHLFKAETALAG